MKYLKGYEIRRMWLDFFASKGHMIEPGAPLVPNNDPTLLWINSGVAALKKYFDGSMKPKSNRITNAQKSLRTNDIENVGMTARHHTFFEMLGNFSIGDYFREEAIHWGYELLTSPKWFGLNKDELYITVHPTDDVTRKLWIKEGIDPSHLVDCEGNYWEIGEGPCGPNTEIFVDRGTKYDPENIGLDLLKNDIENDRYIEIWNIVFSQYNAKEGLKRSEYPELPQKNIDTGAGLERLACIFQGVDTNFETDLFMPIIKETEKYAKIPYSKENRFGYHVIADHIRTCTFALADGAMFSNEGRGYVLRRVLRRAVRFGKKIGINESFMYKLVPTVAKIMEDYYPYVTAKIEDIAKLVKIEEEKFQKTLTAGEQILVEYLNTKPSVVSKEMAFKLYDTYGFPLELTKEIALEAGISTDEEGFKQEMQEQKERARAARNTINSMNRQSADLLNFDLESNFVYNPTPIKAKVIALFKDGVKVDSIEDDGEVVLDTTTFYAESGGQVADTGYLVLNGQNIEVKDVQKAPRKQHLHSVETNGLTLNVGDEVEVKVNLARRNRITRNHSACHLLQKALQEVLGNGVHQAGSYVDEEKLRFDFTYVTKISQEQLKLVERKVNEAIDAAYVTNIQELPIEEAKKLGAMALFGEKYDSIVRVVDFGGYSIEFCGGCHVSNTQDIGVFAIEFEESISSGVRRIQACAGIGGYKFLKSKEEILVNVSSNLGALSVYETPDRLKTLLNNAKETKDELAKLKLSLADSKAKDLLANADTSKGYPVIIEVLNNEDKDMLVKYVDYIKSKANKYAVYFVNKGEDKISLMAACSADLVKSGLHCGKLVKETATMLGGNGGGRPDMAQAGGKDASKIDDVINLVKSSLL